MPAKSLGRYIFLFLFLSFGFTACSLPIGQTTKPVPAVRVLFIGNSYTGYNGGLDQQLKGLAPSTETQRFDNAGYTLEQHWNNNQVLQAIREGKWNHVVLQEQSQTPIIAQRKFMQFARYFDAEIKKSGAQTILLMTWERPDSAKAGVTTGQLTNVFTTLGAELGAPVAPAGIAFARSLRERPKLALYSDDGHPTIPGTYLAACVLYATIFHTSPVGLSYSDWSIDSDTKAYLQRIAAETTGLAQH